MEAFSAAMDISFAEGDTWLDHCGFKRYCGETGDHLLRMVERDGLRATVWLRGKNIELVPVRPGWIDLCTPESVAADELRSPSQGDELLVCIWTSHQDSASGPPTSTNRAHKTETTSTNIAQRGMEHKHSTIFQYAQMN